MVLRISKAILSSSLMLLLRSPETFYSQFFMCALFIFLLFSVMFLNFTMMCLEKSILYSLHKSFPCYIISSFPLENRWKSKLSVFSAFIPLPYLWSNCLLVFYPQVTGYRITRELSAPSTPASQLQCAAEWNIRQPTQQSREWGLSNQPCLKLKATLITLIVCLVLPGKYVLYKYCLKVWRMPYVHWIINTE